MGSCLTLRTATLIIGYLKATIFTLLLIFGVLLVIGVDINLDDSHQDHDKNVKSALNFLGTFVIVVTAINLVFVCLLLNGAHTGNPRHLQCYIIFTYINLVLGTISFLMNPKDGLAMLPGLIIELSCVVVVRCHKTELDSEPAVAADQTIMVKV